MSKLHLRHALPGKLVPTLAGAATRALLLPLLIGLAAARPCTAAAAATAAASAAATAAAVRPTPTTYLGRAAWRLSDGITEAIVVPALGRVMCYRHVGGSNWLWNTSLDANGQAAVVAGGWRNWGGDKTWPSPQSAWPVLVGSAWPVDSAWDGASIATLQGDALHLESAVSPYNGARVARTYRYGAGGEFIIDQCIEKLQGAPMMMALWNVTQVEGSNAVYLPAAPDSLYRDGFVWLSHERPRDLVTRLTPRLIGATPSATANFKIGTDSELSAIAAQRGDELFVERGIHQTTGDYPDAPGVAVQMFNNKGPVSRYVEIELQSTLSLYKIGSRGSYRVVWSLHHLPAGGHSAAAVQNRVEDLLTEAP